VGIILTQGGGQLLDQSGAVLWDQAGAPAPSFPLVPLGVLVELGLTGGSVADAYPPAYPASYGTAAAMPWTDATSNVYQREGSTAAIAITRGRADETQEISPSSCALELNNRDGRYSPKNPLGPYYGQLGRNAPLRVSVPSRTSYLRSETDAASGAACPDAARLRISGTADVRADLRLSDWQGGSICGNWGASQSWRLALSPDGTLSWEWSPDGTLAYYVASTNPLPARRLTVRVLFDPGAGTVTFYTGPPGAATAVASSAWTQLGAQSGFAPTTLNAGTSGLSCAGFYGAAYELAVFSGNGTAGGTLAADADFTVQAAGAGSFTDGPGNAWTVTGTAEISDRSYRYHGEVASLPGKWDVTGRDVSVPLTAGGLLRRLGQGDAPADSPLKRAILLQAGGLAPVQYWPCEDLQGAVAIGSATGGPLMRTQGGTGDGTVTTSGPSFAADSSFLCSSALPTLNGSAWYGQVPPYSGSSAWTVRFPCKLGTLPASGWSDLFRVATTGKCRAVEVLAYSDGSLGLNGYLADGTVQFSTGPVAFEAGGQARWYSVEAQPVSGGVRYSLVTLAPGAPTAGVAEAVVATGEGYGNVTAVWANPDRFFTDTVLGHVSVQKQWSLLGDLAQPLDAWQGETAGNRFARLCGENGLQCRIVGAPDTTAVMGAQPVDTLPAMLQECESADRGQIFEPRHVLGLGYRTLASMLGQAPAVSADYTAAVLGGVSGDPSDSGLDPTYDDQYTRNDETVTRASGSVSGATYRYQLDDGSAMSVSEPPAGIGDYSDSQSVNVLSDSQLPDIAGWLVHLGTVDEARWPNLPWNLARPGLAGTDLYWDLLEADIGDFGEIANLPGVQTPDPARQLFFQAAENFGGFHYTMTHNAVPESPYECAVFDDPVYGIADTDGSELDGSVSASAVTLLVATTGPSGIRWATTGEGAMVPFDIKMAGERMTVTDIAGTSSPQTFTVVRSVNGVVKAQDAGAALSLWFTPYLSLAV
jgi:hypothetical protein